MSKLWHFCKRCLLNETISYLFFGVLTTIVSYVSFGVALGICGEDNALWANVISFIAAVLFAYITNKLFVFNSKSWRWSVLKKEFPSFIGGRLFSFGLEEVGLWLCVDIFTVGRYALWGISGVMIAKIILSFVAVAVNYVLSKFLVFRRKDAEK